MIHIGKRRSIKHLKCTNSIYDRMNYTCSYQHTKNKHVAVALRLSEITLKMLPVATSIFEATLQQESYIYV